MVCTPSIGHEKNNGFAVRLNGKPLFLCDKIMVNAVQVIAYAADDKSPRCERQQGFLNIFIILLIIPQKLEKTCLRCFDESSAMAQPARDEAQGADGEAEEERVAGGAEEDGGEGGDGREGHGECGAHGGDRAGREDGEAQRQEDAAAP